MLKEAVREYWFFLGVGVFVLYLMYKHMRAANKPQPPHLYVTPGPLDMQRVSQVVDKLSQGQASLYEEPQGV